MSTRPVRDDQHGTTTGYGYGCRCWSCRKSVADKRRLVKAVGIGSDDPRHGTLVGYASHGCRCGPCRQAHSEYQNSRRPVTEDVTPGVVRQWGLSLGLPLGPKTLPAGLIVRWNREHPDRPYVPKVRR